MIESLHPFEASLEEIRANLASFVDSFVESLQSFFLVMPRGLNFVEFSRFQQAYLVLKRTTENFKDFSDGSVTSAVRADSMVLTVLRSMLGLSPPEFAYVASAKTGVNVDQSSARRIDKRARDGRDLFARTSDETQKFVTALVSTSVALITEGAPRVIDTVIHRMNKTDTERGIEGVRAVSEESVPYEVLLYERFLGRPFATHRDSVSEQVGEPVEQAVRMLLGTNRIPFHEAGVAERFEDMDQAPDFLVPDRMNPKVVIEAKLAEDDGTARDKVTRVQHLAELREARVRIGKPAFEVVACVDGRGFGIRREDVRKLLFATEGKLFTLKTAQRMVETTRLKDFRVSGA